MHQICRCKGTPSAVLVKDLDVAHFLVVANGTFFLYLFIWDDLSVCSRPSHVVRFPSAVVSVAVATLKEPVLLCCLLDGTVAALFLSQVLSSSAADAFLNSKARSVVCRSEHVGRLLVKVPPPALCAVVCGRQLVAVNEGTLFIHSTLGDAQSFSLQARLPVPRLKQGITSRDRLSLKPVLLSVTCEDRASIPDSVCLHKRFFQLLFGAESVLGGQAHVLVGCTSGQVLFCAPSSLSFSSHPLLCDLGQPVVGIYAPTISPAESLFFLGQQGKLVVCKVAPSHAQLVFQEFCCTAPVLSSVVSGETIFYSTTTGVYSVAMGGSSSGKVLPKKLLRGSCFILETLPGLRLVAVSTSGKFNLINVPDQDGLLGTGACFKDSLLGMQLLSECVAQVQVCLCECELHLSCLSQALSVCRDVVGGSSQLPCAPTPALLQGSPCVKAELSALGSSWSVFLQLKDEDFCVSTSVYHLSCADPGSPLVPLHSSRTVLQCFLSYSFDCVCPTADHIFPDVLIPFSTQSFSGLNFLSRENVDPAEPVCESPISVLVDVPLPSLSKAATDLVSSSLNKQQTLVTTHKGTRMRLVASPLSAGSTRLSMEAATLYPLLELAAHLKLRPHPHTSHLEEYTRLQEALPLPSPYSRDKAEQIALLYARLMSCVVKL